METKIHRDLNTIQAALIPLKDDPRLTSSQANFIQHIDKTNTTLSAMIQDLPPTDTIMMQILPVLGDAFLQPIVALYGYARLLLDSPASFDGATVPEDLRSSLQTIYETGLALYHESEILNEKALDYRLRARQQAPHPLNGIALITDNLPVYRYWIRRRAVQLQIHFEQDALMIAANPYHLNELIRHIIVTLASELIEYGLISLSGRIGDKIELHITCTGLQIDDEVMKILFQKDGRQIYLKQIQFMQGTITTQVERGRSSTITIAFPILNVI